MIMVREFLLIPPEILMLPDIPKANLAVRQTPEAKMLFLQNIIHQALSNGQESGVLLWVITAVELLLIPPETFMLPDILPAHLAVRQTPAAAVFFL